MSVSTWSEAGTSTERATPRFALAGVHSFWTRPVSADWSLPTWMFTTLWYFIGAVSAYDAYLLLKYQVHLYYLEMNPLGRLLLAIEAGDPALFIALKFGGTIAVLGTLNLLNVMHPRLAAPVACIIALFQFVLLGVLTLA